MKTFIGKRKRGGKSRTGAGRYKYRRTAMVVSRPLRSIQNQVHRFKRNFALTTLTGIGAAVYGGQNYVLSQLPNYTELTALFDQYKMTHVKVRFQLVTDPSGVAPATAFVPRIWTVVDKNTDAAPASVNELREYGNVSCRSLVPYKPVTVNIKPHTSTETATSQAALMRRSPWINTSSATVYHYGLRYAIDNLPTNYKVEIEVTAWLSCKNQI